MGKGRRNRERHLQQTLSGHTVKAKKAQKSPVPTWLPSVIALVVVIAIMIPLIASAISGSGVIGRNRVLIESKSGKFDVNQQMATFIAWEALYESGLTQYQYMQYGLIQDEYGITKYYSMEDYAMLTAQTGINSSLRDCIDDVLITLKHYVAVCDLAYEQGVKLNEEDEASVEEVLTWLEDMQDELGYSTFSSFLKTVISEGLKKKDVRSAVEMVVLYNKYVKQQQLDLDQKITFDDLLKYRDENPDSFYKIDYLSFSTADKIASETLAATKNAKEFKEAVVKLHFDENYKSLYNKYTTVEAAAEEESSYASLIDQKDDDNKKLSEKLDELSFEAKKTIKDNDESLNADLVKTVFEKARKIGEKLNVVTDDGVYLVVFYSELATATEKGADDKDVIVKSYEVRTKFIPFVEGEEHGDDKTFKADLFKILTENNNDTKDEDKTKTDYQTASEKVSALVEKLNAENADVNKILADNSFITNKEITDTTKDDEDNIIPEDVLTEALKSTANKAYAIAGDEGNFVLYVHEIAEDKKSAKISYVEQETDLFCKLRDDLQSSLDKQFSPDTTASYKKDAEDGSFEKWISETTTGFESARKDGDVKVIEKTETDSSDSSKKTTTYTVYMALQNTEHGDPTMLYLDHTPVVKGGYLMFTEKAAADAAAAALAGKTGVELLEALALVESDNSSTAAATTSDTLTEEALEKTNETLAGWFFDEARKADEIAVVAAKDSSDKDVYYLAVYQETVTSWERSARTALLTEQLTDWIEALSAPYAVNEKNLDKIGTPSTTVAATTSTPA